MRRRVDLRRSVQVAVGLAVTTAAFAAVYAVGHTSARVLPARPGVAVGVVSVVRPDVGSVVVPVPVSLSWASGAVVSARFATVGGSAEAGVDFVAGSGSVVFTPGQTRVTVPVTVLGDGEAGPNLSFKVVLSAVVGARLDEGGGSVTMVDAHGPMVVSVSDAMVMAGLRARLAFPVVLSSPVAAGHSVKVSYGTAEGTARAGVDFTPVSGSVTFQPGQQTEDVDVPVLDSDVTRNKTLHLDLSAPVGATLGQSTALGVVGAG